MCAPEPVTLDGIIPYTRIYIISTQRMRAEKKIEVRSSLIEAKSTSLKEGEQALYCLSMPCMKIEHMHKPFSQ